ncbi:peptidase associated/transthyretin-like domain-containing protein [Crateriforma conspicua]|nr:hypothetical protein [Crateriforma conspicua]
MRMKADDAYHRSPHPADRFPGAKQVCTVLLLVAMPLFIVGCGSSRQPGDLVPITGLVTVDGDPAQGVVIQLHPPQPDPPLAQAITDAEGRFAISTRTAGDGATPGSYDVTFVWSTFNAVTRSQEGDKLNGRYADPSSTSIHWDVPDADSWDAGTITLSTE